MSPPKRVSPPRLFIAIYRNSVRMVQKSLDGLSLAVALVVLHRLHRITTFVNPGFPPARPYKRTGPRHAVLVAEHHPSRTAAYKTAGLKDPPPGVRSVHNKARLALPNIAWMQLLRQYPYRRKLKHAFYNFLVQISPFSRNPRGPNHFVVAATRKEPLDWRSRGIATLERRVMDMCECVSQLRGFAMFWNGDGAGGTIREWFHAHLLRVGRLLPVQLAARRAASHTRGESVLRIGEEFWPIPAFRIRGTPEFIARQVARLAENWTQLAGSRATECIAILRDGKFIDAYYFPRDRERESVDGFSGLLGTYECCGVLIYSDPGNGAALAAGQIGFDEIWGILNRSAPELEWEWVR